MTSREASNKLTSLVERCTADLTCVAPLRDEGDGLAHEVGGELAFQWRVVVVRAIMASPPDSDAVREIYGEIVDRYRDDAKKLAALRPLGDEIRRLEAEGTLPSALVARSDRRSRH